VIRSFRDAEVEKLFHDQFSKRFQPLKGLRAAS
jgi:hypothetical protein